MNTFEVYGIKAEYLDKTLRINSISNKSFRIQPIEPHKFIVYHPEYGKVLEVYQNGFNYIASDLVVEEEHKNLYKAVTKALCKMPFNASKSDSESSSLN